MQFFQGGWWSAGRGTASGQDERPCGVLGESLPQTDCCSDLWEGLLHTMDQHCGHRDRFLLVPLRGFVGLRCMKSYVSLKQIPGSGKAF